MLSPGVYLYYRNTIEYPHCLVLKKRSQTCAWRVERGVCRGSTLACPRVWPSEAEGERERLRGLAVDLSSGHPLAVTIALID